MILEVWLDIDGLSSENVMVNQLGLKDAGFAFNKVDKYKSMMKTPSTYADVVTKSKGKEHFGIRSLMLEHGLLAYMVAWIITPRGSSHAQLNEEDLLLINLMEGRLKIKWVNIIVDIMLKMLDQVASE